MTDDKKAGKTKKRILIALLVVLGMLAVLAAAFVVVFDVPGWQRLDPDRLHALAQTSSLYDADGELMSELRGAENRTSVPLSAVPKHTQQAFLAAEDLRFYSHRGIDIVRIFGALRSNLISGSFSEGASTITQQLAKLTHLSSEKTIRRARVFRRRCGRAYPCAERINGGDDQGAVRLCAQQPPGIQSVAAAIHPSDHA